MDKRILCICRNGYCRSVATKMCLNKRGYKNVVSIGGINTPAYVFTMLCWWADIILLAKPKHKKFIGIGEEPKIDKKFTIGEDIWLNPYNKDLHKIINKQLDLIGL